MMRSELSVSQRTPRQTMTFDLFCLGNGREEKVENWRRRGRRGGRREGMRVRRRGGKRRREEGR